MHAIELREIPGPIREEYVTLIEDIALSVGVAPENISELLRSKQRAEEQEVAQGTPVRIRLSVEKEFAIDLDSTVAGRVFELAGQSDRNKTTSLIYVATLLGTDWEEARPFLDRDDKVYDVATQFVLPMLSRGQKAELRLTSTGYELSVSVAESRAIISLLDGDRRPLPEFDSKVVPLMSPEDWQQFRRLMAEISDVQFVGKSRDFIGQVSIEESKDLVKLCNEVSTRAGHLLRYFQNLPQDQVYGRTEQDLAAEIASLSNRITELKNEIGILNQEISNQRKLIEDSHELIALRRELEDDDSLEVKEALKSLRLEERAIDQDKRRRDVKRAIQDLKCDLNDLQRQLDEQAPLLTAISDCLWALRECVLRELKDLTALSSYASQLPRHIANKEHEQILAFCDYAQVSDETVDLLDSVLEAINDFSKGLIIPQISAEQPGTKLADFAKQLLIARGMAVDIQRLNPELTNAYEALRAAGIDSAQSMRRLESSVDTTQMLVREKERSLKERRDELEVVNKTLESILGPKKLSSLRERGEQLAQSLPHDRQGQLSQVELLSHSIGYTRPWQLTPSDLEVVIRDRLAKIRDLEEKKQERERSESQLRKRLIEVQRSKLRTDDIRPQPDALRSLQDILGYIVSYLDDYRRRREGLQGYSVSQLEQLRQNLGENLDRVHRTLNRVIRQRCPVMYKNRASGPVKLHVQDYDFLEGRQSIPELQAGEWAGGGGDSAMTVLGLATRSSGSYVGTILLVDEFNDAETFKQIVCNDLASLERLAFAIFVKQDPESLVPSFEVIQ